MEVAFTFSLVEDGGKGHGQVCYLGANGAKSNLLPKTFAVSDMAAISCLEEVSEVGHYKFNPLQPNCTWYSYSRTLFLPFFIFRSLT
ncbi:hypothetical protein PanWU01x14_053900 [Parasponia andersonii]|uniref:Uncharacterized protein n=1 Tax=Parasponia andersonii TaxID=3476 RepID=A0A2P5DKM7_PARAD|nr:hypothetical protein PanWU01x14_053900 [Parasponia andersonii]